jgi:hypothetical protein
LRKLAIAALIAAYFLYFNWASLHVHFAIDDLGNTAHYYLLGPRVLVLSQFRIWVGDSRPLAGLFYVPIYHFAGLNPVPYQAVMLALLLGVAFWEYRFARLLGCGEMVATVAALGVCYNAGLANLYYNAAFIFDVLCCFFYLAALVYYLRIRARGQALGAWQTVAFLALLLCALNSKEMAVSVSVMLLVYEWCYHPPAELSWQKLWAWVRGPARVVWFAALLTAVDIYGKLFTPAAMVQAEAYRPVFSLRRIHDFQRAAFQDLSIDWAWMPAWGTILFIHALLAFLAWRRPDRPVLRFLFWFIVIAPLPIEFLPGKRQGEFAVMLLGWALFAAVVVVDLARGIADILAREPLFKRLKSQVWAAILVVAAVYYWAAAHRDTQTHIVKESMDSLGFETWDLIQQFRQLKPPPRDCQVMFLDDPFHTFDMDFLAALWIHDRSVEVHTWRDRQVNVDDPAKMDMIYTIENRKVIRLK